ncbi:phytanoyl-CoA dioxygenase family protein (plasmid) [Vibrio sp. SS-MA-C1-2]|uniref:phytanoyl-CoA dioxygenase family protein n=1 Tax=Vibrio sp. SS-MA-C1-2 TaxID=2908646 RepID=UPI001F31980E|nr:phytanoyl-CoA dioxygenase family protein [Vibrio sp. SS-MA-C1-2]UJF20300.1 phytanoyl-CoA dioxygenase family protein [Vibrio sp. SS-MA-C1-2]
MIECNQPLSHHYEKEGYFVIRNYFDEAEILSLRKVILKFHQEWKTDNGQFYQEEAFNSSLITGSEYLSDNDRATLFNFISSQKMMEVIDTVIPKKPSFMNTQLFFNPVNPQQKDFWHRDCQYDYDIEDQMKVIMETQVLHLRIPLFDELGMEVIPGTHKRWDNDEEFNVRQEMNGKVSSDNISGGKQIPLSAGDLLVFSADMIHRGLYGLDRLAWDILIFESAADYADYVDDDCLPTQGMLKNMANPRLFLNTLDLKSTVGNE